MTNIRYRIGVVNDFRDTYAFTDYRKYGVLEIFDACLVGGANPAVYQKSTDSIRVFLDFKQVGEYKTKDGALSKIYELLAEAPSKDFETSKDVLIMCCTG